jgi:hypothetical protein
VSGCTLTTTSARRPSRSSRSPRVSGADECDVRVRHSRKGS